MDLSLTAAPLVPSLPDVACKRTRHDITDLKDGDLLHVRANIVGADGLVLFRKGTILPVFGYCRLDELNGLPYQVRAYVPGFGTTWAAREARRFPTALQQEVWFGAHLLHLSELDLTDHADALALERHSGGVVIALYPRAAHMLRAA